MGQILRTAIGLLLMSGLSSCAAERSQPMMSMQADDYSADISVIGRGLLSGGYGDNPPISHDAQAQPASSATKRSPKKAKKTKKAKKKRSKKAKKTKKTKKTNCVPDKALGKKCKKVKRTASKNSPDSKELLKNGKKAKTSPGSKKPKKAKAAATDAEGLSVDPEAQASGHVTTDAAVDASASDSLTSIQDDGSALVVFSTELEGTLFDAGGDMASPATPVGDVAAADGDSNLAAPIDEQPLDIPAGRRLFS